MNNEWLDGLKALAASEAGGENEQSIVRLAKIDPSWVRSSLKAKVLFDGETALTTKEYLLGFLGAVPGQRVVMLRVGSTYVAISAVSGTSYRAQDTWHNIGAAGEPAWVNGWVGYSDANFGTVQFRKTLDGMVVIRGLGTGTAATADHAFTLPTGYRPARSHIFASAASGIFKELRVGPEGGVTLADRSSWGSFACTFFAEQ